MPVTEYVWDDVNDCVLEETDEFGATQVTYTHEPGPFGPLVSEYRGGTTYNHHNDALGSTTLLTDDTGAMTDTFQYDAWGNQVARTGTTPTPYTWVGKWGYQDDTATAGGYYIRARTYGPRIARWESVDPLLRNMLIAYLYTSNNAANRTDSSGADSDDECKPTVPGQITYIPNRVAFSANVTPFIDQQSWPRLATAVHIFGRPLSDDSFVKKGCCCCDRLAYIQIDKQHSESNSHFFDMWNNADWRLDTGSRYGLLYAGTNISSEPCKNRYIAAQFADEPSTWLFYPVPVPGLNRLKPRLVYQQFETCLACIQGTEGPLTSPVDVYSDRDDRWFRLNGLTVYGCISWYQMYSTIQVPEWSFRIGQYSQSNLTDPSYFGHVYDDLPNLTINAPSDTFKALVLSQLFNAF